MLELECAKSSDVLRGSYLSSIRIVDKPGLAKDTLVPEDIAVKRCRYHLPSRCTLSIVKAYLES